MFLSAIHSVWVFQEQNTHTHTHTVMHTHTHTHSHTHTHTHTNIRTHTHTHAHALSLTHTHICTLTRERTHSPSASGSIENKKNSSSLDFGVPIVQDESTFVIARHCNTLQHTATYSLCRDSYGSHKMKVKPIPRGVTFSKALSKLKAESSNVSLH